MFVLCLQRAHSSDAFKKQQMTKPNLSQLLVLPVIPEEAFFFAATGHLIKD